MIDPIKKPLLLRETYSGTCSQKLLEILFKALLQQNSTKCFLQFVSSHSHLNPLYFAPITLLKLLLSRSSQTSTLPHPGLGLFSSFFLTNQHWHLAHWPISLDLGHSWALLPPWYTVFTWSAGHYTLDFCPTRKTKKIHRNRPIGKIKNCIYAQRGTLYQCPVIQRAWGSSDLKVCNIIKPKSSAPN